MWDLTKIFPLAVKKHMGPGPHPVTGTSQAVHGREREFFREASRRRAKLKRPPPWSQKIMGRRQEEFFIERQQQPKHAADSQDFYKTGREPTDYTKKRKALHDQIVREILAQCKEKLGPGDVPVLYVLGGGTASGKSTAKRAGLVKGMPDCAPTIDADHIKEALPEYRVMSDAFDKKAAGFGHEESSDISKRALLASLGARKNTVLDSVGNSPLDKLTEKIKPFRDAGYKVRGTYMTVPVKQAQQWALKRYKETGRYVPPEVVDELHTNVSAVFPQAVKAGLFDEVDLVDNTSGKPTLVLSHRKGKTTIHNAKLWAAFLKKGGLTRQEAGL